MTERIPIPITYTFDWIVETYPQTGADGITREELFIFPPAKWSVSAFGPKQTGSVWKIEQRMIPAKTGLLRIHAERYYDEEKEQIKEEQDG